MPFAIRFSIQPGKRESHDRESYMKETGVEDGMDDPICFYMMNL
jgi:hypothetical protein